MFIYTHSFCMCKYSHFPHYKAHDIPKMSRCIHLGQYICHKGFCLQFQYFFIIHIFLHSYITGIIKSLNQYMKPNCIIFLIIRINFVIITYFIIKYYYIPIISIFKKRFTQMRNRFNTSFFFTNPIYPPRVTSCLSYHFSAFTKSSSV